MESTKCLAISILNSAFDAARIAASKTLEYYGIDITETDFVNEFKQEFDYILDDSGVRNNLIGKACSVDWALNRRLNSAKRNRDWMTTIDTVHRLDQDVNQLRMLLASKGIDQSTRVLYSCFQVSRLPGKSSSIITCKPNVFEKLKRGEIIVENTDEEMEIENLKYREMYEDLKAKHSKHVAYSQARQNEWARKMQEMGNKITQLQDMVYQQNLEIQDMRAQNLKLERDINLHIDDICVKLSDVLDSAPVNGEFKRDLVGMFQSIKGVDFKGILDDFNAILHHLLTEYQNAYALLDGLASIHGLQISFE